MKQPTEFQLKLLRIINDKPGIQTQLLSEHLWPDATGHKKQYNNGPNAVVVGKGMWMAAAGQAGKLRKKGWIRKYARYVGDEIKLSGYIITKTGCDVLAEFAPEQNEQTQAVPQKP